MKIETNLPNRNHRLEVGDVFHQSFYPYCKKIVSYFFYKGFYDIEKCKHKTDSGVFRITKLKTEK